MHPESIFHANIRLNKAEKALIDLQKANNKEDAEFAWIDYLVATGSIFSKLENGSKKSETGKSWFEDRKRERKTDPLLRYLHEARNSDQHGIVSISGVSTINSGILKFNERVPIKISRQDSITGAPYGDEMDAVFAGPTLKPITIHLKRDNQKCEPPTQHFGVDIQYHEFIDSLAATALPYFRRIVKEAECLSTKPN
jgi:hypothetical protein